MIVAIAAIAASLAVSPPLGVLRGLSLDVETALRWRFIGNSHDGAASPTVVVALDEETYRTAPFQGTPSVMWTREIGRVVAATLDAGASVVGFDVVFPSSIEESRISFDGETIAARLRGFDRDYLRALAAAAKSGKIVLGEIQHGDEMIQPTAGQRVAVGQQRNIRSLNVVSDPDDVVRRAPLTLASTSGPTPSMALELAARALGVAPVIGPDRGVGIAGVDFPADADGAMILNFDGGADDIPTYSFADLSACLDKGDEDFFRRNFAGKIVLLGSRLDLGDLKLTSKRFATAPPTRPWERCATPPGAGAPIARSLIDGVFVHATAINNIVRHEAVRDLAAGPRWLIAWAGAAMAATAAFALTPAAAAGAVLVLALAWTGVATAAFAHALALPLLQPMLAAIIALVAATSHRLFVTERDKRFLRRNFGLYLSPIVIEKMVRSNVHPTLGGEIRDVTILFSDLAGFSTLSENLKPSELVALMNRYLSAMTDVIEEHGGFVDKYIGDAIVAVFGAPAGASEDAVDAVRAALACGVALERLNAALSAANGLTLAHRVGLNSGQALVGNIGSARRFNYTVIGDAVNIASRLEDANRHFGAGILASEATMALTGEIFAWREVDVIRVKGRTQPVRIYEPLGLRKNVSSGRLDCAASYAEGLSRWRQRDFAGAAQSFARHADIDPPSALFGKRCERFIRDPPAHDWAPVTVLD